MQSLKKFYFGKQKGIPFIIKVNATSTFTIPTTGSGYNYRVKTSDGQILTNRTANTTITFPSSGIYTIEISEAFPRICFDNTGDRLLLIDIVQWGSQKWITLEKAFYGCSNLKCTAIDYPNLKITTNTSFCFANCTSFGAASDINNIGLWDVSNVTNMQKMFENATNFNKDISAWNVSKVTNFQAFLYQCTSFNQNLNSWNISAAITIQAMFEGCTNFNQPVTNWNTSNVFDMGELFSRTKYNHEINLWDVSKVTNFRAMFFSNIFFNQDISLWNTASVTNMKNMFNGATAFNQNIGSWNVSNVTNFINFMSVKTPATFSATNLDAIYNGWSTRPVKTPISISFGTAKYTSASSVGRAILTSAPNNWVITDGGI